MIERLHEFIETTTALLIGLRLNPGLLAGFGELYGLIANRLQTGSCVWVGHGHTANEQ
jgi:hypothetical protein